MDKLVITEVTGALISDYFEARETELVVHGYPPFEEWLSTGKSLRQAEQSLPWWLADWWVWGEQVGYTRRIADAEEMGYSWRTIANYGYVGRAIPSSRRREPSVLSFSHHQEVASLSEEEQERYLTLAEKRNWSRRDLREHLAKTGKRDPVLAGLSAFAQAGEGDANRPDPMRVIDDELASHPERRISLQARPDGGVMVDVEEGGECRSYGVDPDRLGEELADIMRGGRVPDSRRPVASVRVVTCPQCGCEVELEEGE